MASRKSSSSIASVQQIAQRQPALASAIRQAEAFIELNRRIQPKLPTEVRKTLRVACVEGDCLVIAAASPVWATKARLLANVYLDACNELWPQQLNKIKVVVISEAFEALDY
ncbi:MAG: DciA family protein [Pseudomonadota bacterium]